MLDLTELKLECMYNHRSKYTLFGCSEGGYFKAHLTFPKEYPDRPPKLTFVSEIWHPNS